MKIMRMKSVRQLYQVCFLFLMFFALSASSLADMPASGQKVAFNFVDVEIPAVIKFISELTGKNFIYDERVKGKINIVAPTRLSIEQSFALFTSVLELKGFTIIPIGANVYKIIPSSIAKQAGKISLEEEFPVGEAYITRLLPLEHIKSSDAVQFLAPLISRSGHISTFSPGNLLLVVDSALNVGKLMSILKYIDKPPTYEEPPQIHVYPLENADALELSKVLEGMVKSTLTANKGPNKSTGPFGWISITPDKSTNSLIIMASPSDYQNIAQVLKDLDKRRRQVYVEAMIIEASVDKLKDLGTEWRASVTHSGEPIAIGGLGTISSVKLQDIISGLTGFSAGGLGNFFDIPISSINTDGTVTTSNLTVPGFSVLFSLSIFEDIINVLSTPQILTSDNEEAEIVVGENVPFISARERDITTTNTVLSSIERQDVGIRLKITPQITEGDYVKLDLYQEISSVKEASEEIVTTVGPTTTKRATKTSVVVRDAHTVVISGLMEEKDEEGTSKIPILGDIPLLGWLFKHKAVTKRKTNLLVFLTPHIVKDSTQLTKISLEKNREFVVREKFYKDGELMLKFREDIPREKAREIISQKGALVIKHIEDQNTYHIKLREKQKVEDAVYEFSSIPEVSYAEPYYKINIQRAPSHSHRYDSDEYPEPKMKDSSPSLKIMPGEKKQINEMEMKNEDNLREELLIKFKDTVSQESAEKILAKYPVTIMRYDELINVYRVKLGPSQKEEDAIKEFSSIPEVFYTVPYYKIKNQDEGSLFSLDSQIDSGLPALGIEQTEDNALPVLASAQEKPLHISEQVKTTMQNRREAETERNIDGEYFIQVGSWKHPEYAEEAFEKLKAGYPHTYITVINDFTTVRIPGITDQQQGRLIIQDLEETMNVEPILLPKK
jgi:general secretion pathway protein D